MSIQPDNAEQNPRENGAGEGEKETVNEKTEFSIFDDPAHFADSAPKKKTLRHPMLVKILSALLAVAVISAAAAAAVKFIPKKAEEDKDGDISVLNIEAAQIKSMSVKTEDGEISFDSRISESPDSSEVVWTVDGVDEKYTDSSKIKSKVNAAAAITAVEKIRPDADTDYGFDNAGTVLEIKTENSLKTVSFGDAAPANTGVYCRVSDEEGVYVVPLSSVTQFNCTATDFAKTDGFTGIEITSKNNSCFASDGTITDFDYITLSGKDYPTPLRVVLQPDDAVNAYFAFKITSPTSRIGDNDSCQDLVDLFAKGLSAAGAYAFAPDAAELEKYSLNNPDIVLTISLKGEQTELYFSKVDDTYCAMLEKGGDVIYKVERSAAAFTNKTATDYYSTFLVLENLSGLRELRVEAAGKTYTFQLEYSAGDDGTNAVYKAFYGGAELDIANFKSYYQTIIEMNPISYESGSNGAQEVKITFVHSGDLGDTVLAFRPYSAQRYQAEINGTELGLVTRTAVDTLVSNTQKVCENQSIK